MPGAGERAGRGKVENGGMTVDPRRLLPNMDLLLGHPALVERVAE